MTSEPDHSQQMAQWLEKCKPMIKNKMTENIDIRAEKMNQVVNHTIQTVGYPFILPQVPIFEVPSTLTQSAKQELWNKVDFWTGLGCFRKQSCDFKTYKKNSDNWWNRHKAEWIGDYFFYPLLTDVIPNHIRTVIFTKEHSPNLNTARYNLLLIRILHVMFHSELSFARTKFLPLILNQSLLFKKCKNTLQALFITLGNQAFVPWDNHHIKKGQDARAYSQQWVQKALVQTQFVYDEILRTHQDDTRSMHYANHNAVHSIRHQYPDVDMSISDATTQGSGARNNNHNDCDYKDVNDVYLDASGVIPETPMNIEPIYPLNVPRIQLNDYSLTAESNSIAAGRTPTDMDPICSLHLPQMHMQMQFNDYSFTADSTSNVAVHTPTDMSCSMATGTPMEAMEAMDDCLMFGMDEYRFNDCDSVKI